MSESNKLTPDDHDSWDIAVVGMAGRFPQAENLGQFWRNIAEGRDCVNRFSTEELDSMGVPHALSRHPDYVPAAAVVKKSDYFDANFFGVSPAEARAMDPQHRVFLEVAWQALEDAGYDPHRYDGLIGVYAGCDASLTSSVRLTASAAQMQSILGNSRDYFATRVAFKLNLKGPALTIQTACSTSLVAIQVACQNLLSYQCDMALTGGVGINDPRQAGYVYEDGGILSAEGVCRPFDAEAAGTVGGDGCGVVILKRLQDALDDGDTIHAVIKGAAINNDGCDKAGYTAPSVDGQAAVVAMAQAEAGIKPDSIGYVEAHGTGTSLGDPIEIAALHSAFASQTDKRQFCAIGSLKSNLGHMISAAGVGGFIKTVLALRHRQLPPSINYRRPNPSIDFAKTCFYVNTELQSWQNNGSPRRAGVSSFGFGGTNAHVVLEEAPQASSTNASHDEQLIVVSAKSEAALEQSTAQLLGFLEAHVETDLANVSHTLLGGRQRFAYQRIAVCRDAAEARTSLMNQPPTINSDATTPSVAFMFPGQGSQYAGMTRGIYEQEPLFAEVVDQCAEAIQPLLKADIRDVLFGDACSKQLNQTEFTQPILFTLEYALGQLWKSWGIEPDALIGHSVGEYVAACLAGVFEYDGAIRLLVARARLAQGMPTGAMLAVELPEDEARAFGLTIAAVNGPNLTVLAGPNDQVEGAQEELERRGIPTRKLNTSHAFHTSAMDGMLEDFREEVRRTTRGEPQIPIVSNLTGSWLTASEATSVDYWVNHLRYAVRFNDGVALLMQEERRLLLEVGPGRGLSSLAKRHGAIAQNRVFHSCRAASEKKSDRAVLLHAAGQLFLAGASPNFEAVCHNRNVRRISLPTYPFQREQFERPPSSNVPHAGGREAVEDWLYAPSWTRSILPTPSEPSSNASWIVFEDDNAFAVELIDRLERDCGQVVRVRVGDEYRQTNENCCELNPRSESDFAQLFDDVQVGGPFHVLHLWSNSRPVTADDEQARGCYALLNLAKTLASRSDCETRVKVVTSHVASVHGEEQLCAARATLRAVCQIAPQELPHVQFQLIDVETGSSTGALVESIAEELQAECDATFVAYRGRHRWTIDYRRLQATPGTNATPRVGGVYLITGGLGNIGLTLAEELARSGPVKLVLVSRRGLPPRDQWNPQADPRVARITKLEQAGSEVLVCAADATCTEPMQGVVADARERFGEINGVIHAAGYSGNEVLCRTTDTTVQQCEEQLRVKSDAVKVLDELKLPELDFVGLVSSLSTVVGGPGLLSYAAAHHFLDSVATSRDDARGTRWISVNWDAWNDNATCGVTAILPNEAGPVFRASLALRTPQLVVSTVDLQSRMQQFEVMTHRNQRAGQQRDAVVPGAAAPKTAFENSLAEIFASVLGTTQICVEQDMFQLGGDSLTAIQIRNRIKEAFGVELAVSAIFENPSVRMLARHVEQWSESSPARPFATVSSETVMSEAASETSSGPLITNQLVSEGGGASGVWEGIGINDQNDVRQLYNSVSDQLNRGEFADHSLFLNFGFDPIEPPSSPLNVEDHEIGANPKRLVLELIGDLQLRPSQDLLDIGCGRGGTVSVLRQYYNIGRVAGLDISPTAIAFCQSTHTQPNTEFFVGDALDLPFPDAEFDLITNIESSHSYGDLTAFYREVYRVLRPGGHFLYTDLLDSDRFAWLENELQEIGFVLSRRQNITPGVLRSCDNTAARNAEAFNSGNDQHLLAYFLGMPGSVPYEAMKSGESRYMIYRFEKC